MGFTAINVKQTQKNTKNFSRPLVNPRFDNYCIFVTVAFHPVNYITVLCAQIIKRILKTT